VVPVTRRRSSTALALLIAISWAIGGCAGDARRLTRQTQHTDTGSDPPSARLLFDGKSERGWYVQSAGPTRIRVVRDPAGGHDSVLRFEAHNGDVFPRTPTANPRAQLIVPLPVRRGGQFWESYELYVPSSFPVGATYSGWLGLGSPAYGPPFSGPPSVGLSIGNGDFRFQRDGFAADPWQIAWHEPVVLRRWIRFTWHVKLSRRGFVQLYVNGRPVELTSSQGESTTLHMAVLDPGNAKGPWISQISAYYKLNEFPQVTLYFRDFRIATTKAIAES
jgi:hypothetical protein